VGGERRGPEEHPGAAPGDDETPEHSRGSVLDDPQPSAPRKPELESDRDRTDDGDVNSSVSDI
jgi:hypothetical protein